MKYVLAICLFSISLSAQKDSSRLILSGIQADINSGFYTTTNETDQQHFQAFVKSDPNLYANLNGYQKENSYFISGTFFEQIAGGKCFFQLKKSNKFRSEFFIGLRFTQHVVNAVSYSNATIDTVGKFNDPQTGATKYIIKENSSNYYFLIRGNTLYLPLGMNFTTNSNKFFWFSAGIELAPSVLFNHTFVSDHDITVRQSIVAAGQSPDSFGSDIESFSRSANTQKTRGLGTGIYLGVPLSFYIHPMRKETNGLQGINLFVTLMPLATYSTTSFSSWARGFTGNVGAGVRYNLRKPAF
jgi:hypothetical protein